MARPNPKDRFPAFHPPAFHPPAFHPPAFHPPAFHPPAFHPIDTSRALRQFPLVWETTGNMRERMESRRAMSDLFTHVHGL